MKCSNKKNSMSLMFLEFNSAEKLCRTEISKIYKYFDLTCLLDYCKFLALEKIICLILLSLKNCLLFYFQTKLKKMKNTSTIIIYKSVNEEIKYRENKTHFRS